MTHCFFILCFILHISVFRAEAQKYTAEHGEISFFSDGAIEDIRAKNILVGSLVNTTSGELVFIAKIKDFIFPNALMREHFNEKYLETEKYPKSTFQGKLTGFDPATPEEQKVKAVGKLQIHGVVREVDVPGFAQIVNGKISMKATFIVRLAEYNIKIPSVVWQNIAEEIELHVNITYKPI